MVNLTIDNKNINVESGKTILEAASELGIYIPVLCSHPDLKPFQSIELSPFIYQGEIKIENDQGAKIEDIRGCGVCLVMDERSGTLLASCKTPVEEGMKISSTDESVLKRRRENLSKIMADHPHSCLTCAQREGCIPMTDVCPGSVVFNERCCALLGKCEIQKVADYVGIAPETQRYQFKNLPIVQDSPLFNYNFNLCIGCGRCVRVCQQVKGVYALGAVISNGKLKIGTTIGPHLLDSECKFCGSCVEVCPTGAIMDKKSPRLSDLCDLVPCKTACPGEVNIPQYLRLVSDGKLEDAAAIISSKLTLPGVLGKVCFHPCETNCRRNELNISTDAESDSINVRWIKDYAIVHTHLAKPSAPKNTTGKKVAVVGGGPAGLTAAYNLYLKGHSVDLYEKEDDIGGLIKFGIPRYRLSADVIEKDLSRIKSTNINFHFNKSLGKDLSLDNILNNGADAVYLAVGLTKSRFLPNFDSSNGNIKYGVEFLNDASKNKLTDDYFKSKSVVVIGGGNVAIDAARTALRYKADSVEIICLEQFNEMPAYSHEIKEALEEGIKIRNGWGISNLKNNNDGTNEIFLKKCLNVFDEKGRFSPTYDETSNESVTCHNVIISIGQEAGNDFKDDKIIQKLMVKGLIKVNNDTYETSVKGIYAGGDIVSGPASVIDAVGAGRNAARHIDLYLGGNGEIDDEGSLNNEYNMYIGRTNGFNSQKRQNANLVSAENRKENFSPVEITYCDLDAVKEAGRCLQCDLRLHIRHNPTPPKEEYLTFDEINMVQLPEQEGVIQLLDNHKEIMVIKGTENIRETIKEMLGGGKEYSYFIYDLDPMYTKRESELIQQYLQKHGKLPDSGDDLDDLF